MSIDLELATTADIMNELERREVPLNVVYFAEGPGLYIGGSVTAENLIVLAIVLLSRAQKRVEADTKENEEDKEG